MKVIKFSSGKYGVRKWSWDIFEFGYVFALNKSGSWANKNSQWVQEFDSLEYANEVLDDMKRRENISLDCGADI